MKKCNSCEKKVRNFTALCRSCYNKVFSSEVIKTKTLGDYKKKYKGTGKHSSWITSEIRQLCRAWNKDLLGKPCEICKYSKHTELHHKKAISSFHDDATLGEINSPDNLMVLCPNCHWEIDNL